LGHLITDGVTRRKTETALACVGIKQPYPLSDKYHKGVDDDEKNRTIHEFEWAFGTDAEKHMNLYTQNVIDKMGENKTLNSIENWDKLNTYDEDSLLSHLELHLDEISKIQNRRRRDVLKNIEFRRYKIAKQFYNKSPDKFENFVEQHIKMEKMLFENNPNELEQIVKYRKKLIERIEKYDTKAAETIKEWYGYK
jgi:hypothetical protein